MPSGHAKAERPTPTVPKYLFSHRHRIRAAPRGKMRPYQKVVSDPLEGAEIGEFLEVGTSATMGCRGTEGL